MKGSLLISLALAAAVAAAYGAALGNGFVDYDDPEYVLDNPAVRAGLTWPGTAWAFTHAHACNYHPLTWLAHMLDWQLFGEWAGGHHLASVALHAANSVLAYLVLRRLTGRVACPRGCLRGHEPGANQNMPRPTAAWACHPREGDLPETAGASAWPSALAAALFALHPAHVESVAWVAERKDVLSTFLGLLALWAYAGYAAQPRWWRYAAVAGLLALGLAAKPMLVTWPAVMLLLDWWPLGRMNSWGDFGRRLAEKIPLAALAAASCAATYGAQQQGGAMLPENLFPLGERLLNALVAYAAYLGLLAWPAGLAVLYPIPEAWPAWQVAASAAVLAAVTVLAVWQRRRRPYLLFGWLWYAGTLVPVIGLVQVGEQAMADRYTYIPYLGLFVALAWGLADAAAGRGRVVRAALPAGAAAALAACGVLAALQVRTWRDTETLFRQAEAVTRHNAVAYGKLGLTLLRDGRHADAVPYFRRAVALRPGSLWNAKVRVNLGNALSALGHTAEAEAEYREAVHLDPSLAEGYYNLGMCLIDQGRPEESVPYLKASLRGLGGRPEPHQNLGMVLGRLSRYVEAEFHLREAVRLAPDDPDIRYNLGLALAALRRFDEALGQFDEALRLRPDHARACRDRDALHRALGR